MADTKPSRRSLLDPEEQTKKNDFAALLSHMQTHPWTYIGAVGFIVLILVVTGVYRMSQKSAYQASAEKFARALDVEDAAKRAEALGTLAEAGTPISARALYMQGESALEAGDREGAKTAFTKLRESYPDYEFVPEAVEGLGVIAEDTNNFAAARGLYEEITTKWPKSVTAQRQPFNIARCLEGENDLKGAVEHYRDQIEAFPGSTIATRAQGRLDELRTAHPELFPEEKAAEAPALQELQTAPDATTPAPTEGAAPTPEQAPATAPETPAAPAETPPATPQ